MLMEVPINLLHNYIGTVVMAGLSIDILRRYFRNPNPTTLYFGLATASVVFVTASFGIPALFTHDAFWLSVFTFVGDLFLSVTLLFLWIISIRAFLSNRPTLAKIAAGSVGLLAAASMVEAIFRNLTYPYGTHIERTATNQLAVIYDHNMLFNILTAVNSLSLLFISIYFIRQASQPPALSQRIRLRGVSIGFIIAAFNFIATPLLPLEKQALFTVACFTVGFLVIAIAGIISIWLIPKEKRAAAAATPTSN